METRDESCQNELIPAQPYSLALYSHLLDDDDDENHSDGGGGVIINVSGGDIDGRQGQKTI